MQKFCPAFTGLPQLGQTQISQALVPREAQLFCQLLPYPKVQGPSKQFPGAPARVTFGNPLQVPQEFRIRPLRKQVQRHLWLGGGFLEQLGRQVEQANARKRAVPKKHLPLFLPQRLSLQQQRNLGFYAHAF